MIANKDPRVLLAENPELKKSHVEYNINVTSNSGERIEKDELVRKMRAHKDSTSPLHLYFHLPFCNYICKFCNYVKKKIPEKNQKQTLDNWSEYLIHESKLSLQSFSWIGMAPVESIYFGGGTSALFSPDQLERILNHVRANYNLTPNCEISLEGNPDNFCGDELQHAMDLGFNRFSVGIQSLQDEVLEFTGRGHSVAMSLKSIERLKATGAPFNVDYMFGLPHQTAEQVSDDIKKLLDMGCPTITIYRLRNADRQEMDIGLRSAWNNKKIRDKIEFPSLNDTYDMRANIVELFKGAKYEPSPCGWWSKPNAYDTEGNIPQVSKNKWQNFDSMIAFGPGVYGWVTGNQADVLQTHNCLDINEYVRKIQNNELPLSHGKQLEGFSALATRLGFNFKARQPIEISKYIERFGIHIVTDDRVGPIISKLINSGFLKWNTEKTALLITLDGEALHEEIIEYYLHETIGGFSEVVCKKQVLQ